VIQRLTAFFAQFDRNLWILACGWFVGALGFAASIPFIAIYFHNVLGMSTTEIGLFFGAMAIVRSVSQAVGGEMSDRIGRSLLLVHTQWVRAISFFFLALVIQYNMGFWWVAGLLTVNSIVGSAFMPAVNAMVADILPPEKRLDGYAISRSAGNLGWAAGPAIGGFLAAHSYAILFHMSAVITLISAGVFWLFLKVPRPSRSQEQFRFSDLMAVRNDRNLARHVVLILCLYLVVAQLVAPFSVYTVEMVGIPESRLGLLFAVNGLMVALLQIPVTRILAPLRFTSQLALGALLYFIGYGALGLLTDYGFFMLIIVVVTTGEMFMSPPSLTLTSRLAPEGRMGRYMGVYGFFVTAGWSLGPLYGGIFLDAFEADPALAWFLISLLALVACAGYLWFGQRLPFKFNHKSSAE